MKMVKAVEFLGKEYEAIIEEGVIKGLKRYNDKYKMWITIKFIDNCQSEVKRLNDMLKDEYIRQQIEKEVI